MGRGKVEVAISDWGWVEEMLPAPAAPFICAERIFYGETRFVHVTTPASDPAGLRKHSHRVPSPRLQPVFSDLHSDPS